MCQTGLARCADVGFIQCSLMLSFKCLLVIQEKNHVSEGVFALPQCAISESVECLVNLAYQTLQEAASNTPQW